MTRTRLSGRLTRAEDATAQFVEPLAIVDHGAANGDADALATELAAAFRQKIENYRKWYKLSEQEAIDRVSKESTVPQQARALQCPPQKLSWQALEEIAEGDPERAEQRWEEVRQAAREELRSGHRAARFIEGRDSSCWDRAQFLALRGVVRSVAPAECAGATPRRSTGAVAGAAGGVAEYVDRIYESRLWMREPSG